MKTNMASIRNLLILSIVFLSPFYSLAQAGALDLSFSNDGMLTKNVGTTNALAYMALQSDGKIVVAGSSVVGSFYDFTLVRYHADGILDTTFDADGIVTTAIGAETDVAYCVAIQSDGRIVTGGLSFSGNNAHFAVVRYQTNGSLDSSFHFDGRVTTPLGTTGTVNAIAIQADGKIILSGWLDNGADYDFALVRYNSDGSVDSSFDTDGIVTTTFGAGYDEVWSMAIQTDGKIVVAGRTVTASDWLFALARYNTNGSLDSTFDTDGKVTTDAGIWNDWGNSVAIQNDGKIVVAGNSSNNSAHQIVLARYKGNGSLDSTFDGDGLLSTGIGPSNPVASSAALQSDGKIVVAGYSSNNITSSDFALVRYNTDGSIDNTFDSDGIVRTAISVYEDYARSVAIQSDGKIVVAGMSRTDTSMVFSFSIARYHASGAADIVMQQNTEFKIYPNPFSTSTTLFSSNISGDASLTVYNIFGQAVKQVSNITFGTGHSITLHRDNLPGGFYFVQLTQDNKIIASSKLMIID